MEYINGAEPDPRMSKSYVKSNYSGSRPVANRENSLQLIEKNINTDAVHFELANYFNGDEKQVKKVIQTVITEIRKNPEIAKCDPNSVIGAVQQCVQMGLSLDSNLGHAALTPKGGKCQLLPMYKGYISLGFRTGLIVCVDAYVVKKNDEFSLKYINGETFIEHAPKLDGNRGELMGSYVVILFKDKNKKITWMDHEEIMICKEKAPYKKVWNEFPEEMYKKTVIRRAYKLMDLSPALSAAVHLDELHEAGIDQNNDRFLGKTIEVELDLQENKTENKKPEEKTNEEWIADAKGSINEKNPEMHRIGTIEQIKSMWAAMQTPEHKIQAYLDKSGIVNLDEVSTELANQLFSRLHRVYTDWVNKKEVA